MSLTKFLQNPEVDNQLEALLVFPRVPNFGLHPRVPSVSSHPALIGAAFDYLLRFALQRNTPFAVTREWVAEAGFRALVDRNEANQGKPVVAERKAIDAAARSIQQAKAVYAEYLVKGELTDELLQVVLRLAQIDVWVRSGIKVKWFGVVDLKDMKELRRLMDIVPWQEINPRSRCVLNPTFGQASSLVGGADADLLIDETLIEIKTTKNGAFSKAYIKQLVGYYILFLLGGIDGAEVDAQIEQLGVYSARYGRIVRVPVHTVIPTAALRKLTALFQRTH